MPSWGTLCCQTSWGTLCWYNHHQHYHSYCHYHHYYSYWHNYTFIKLILIVVPSWGTLCCYNYHQHYHSYYHYHHYYSHWHNYTFIKLICGAKLRNALPSLSAAEFSTQGINEPVCSQLYQWIHRHMCEDTGVCVCVSVCAVYCLQSL